MYILPILIFFCAGLCAMDGAGVLPPYYADPAAPAYMPAVPQRFFFSETGRPHDVEQARILQENYDLLRKHRNRLDGVSQKNLENIFDNPGLSGPYGSMRLQRMLEESPDFPVLYLRKVMTDHRLDAFRLDNPVDDMIPRSFALSDAVMAKLFARPRFAWLDCVAMEQFFSDQFPVDDPRLACAVPITLARIGFLRTSESGETSGEQDRYAGSLSDAALPATRLGLFMFAVRRGYSLTRLKECGTLVKSLKSIEYEKGELLVRYGLLAPSSATPKQKQAIATLRAKILPGIPYESLADKDHLRPQIGLLDAEQRKLDIEHLLNAAYAAVNGDALCLKK